MKQLLTIAAALLSLSVTSSTQTHSKEYVSVAFAIDGKPAACEAFATELRLDGEIIKPKPMGQRFEVPAAFKKPAMERR